MLKIFSLSEATQLISKLILPDGLELPNSFERESSKSTVLHRLELLQQLETYANEGETQQISQLLKHGETEYTFPDQEFFLHFYAYSESVMAATNLNMNLEKEAQKNIDNTKTAFEISNAIKRFEAKE
jgi:hypothetical protein